MALGWWLVTDPYLAGALVALSYPLLLLTSGPVVRAALDATGEDVRTDAADTGRVIGKLENVLVLTVVHLHAFTALGLIFAAKSLVRKETSTAATPVTTSRGRSRTSPGRSSSASRSRC